jgi:two-component system, cell cycle response regulator DivK
VTPLVDRGQHVVRFYDRDDELCQTLAEFVTEGVRRGERIVLLVTPAHWASIRELLVWCDIDFDAVMRDEQVIVVDAHHVLSEIVHLGSIDTQRFKSLLDDTLAPVQPPLRVFGEVVSLIAARGQLDAAIEIEELGHALAHGTQSSVLCAYDRLHLGGQSDNAQRVERCHDRAIIGTSEVQCDGPLVLLADDFEDSRELYRAYFEFKGYRMVAAADGIEALQRAREDRPSVVLLDVRMPGMTGTQVMQALKQDRRFGAVPIVALTAHALPTERDVFLAQGFDAVISKPCLPEDLIQVVERLLSAQRAQ